MPVVKKTYSLLQQMGRMIRKQLVVPLLRSPHPPEYKARGVAVGLAWAMTPLIGIQMWLVFMTWLIGRKVFKWNFSLALGVAWTWVTNVLTMVPVYYVFYVTGQIIRGNFDSIGAYAAIEKIIERTFMSDLGFVDEWVLFFKLLLKDWGVSMIVGSIPWAITGYIVGYRLTMKFERMRAARREKRMKKID